MGGITLAEKCEIAGLLYEAQVCLTAVSSGISTIATMIDSGVQPLRLSERLGALKKMVAQSEEALGVLDDEMEKLLELRAGDDARKLQALEEAVDFYATPMNWHGSKNRSSLILEDGGALARKALAVLERDGDADED